MRRVASLALFLLACAQRQAPAPAPAAPQVSPMEVASPSPPAPAVCTAFAREGVLRRDTVNAVIDAGLGAWLRGVEVSPARDGGKFRGWRIVRLYPDDPCYRAVDLRPGDIALRVNGRSVERPEQANEVFQSLRSASSLKIDYVRDGVPRAITFVIE